MITKEDREKYPYHTDKTIFGIKLIAGIGNRELLSIVKDGKESKYFQAVLIIMGDKTNLSWIISRVAEEAYEREMIDEKKLDELNGY